MTGPDLLDNEDFKKWILNRTKSQTAYFWTQDTYFSCRLLKDMLYGRSKSFNTRGKSGRNSEGLELLYREYQTDLVEGRWNNVS